MPAERLVQVRYEFEHSVLPRYFYTNRAMSIWHLLGNPGKFMVEAYRQCCKAADCEPASYAESDFSENHFSIEKDGDTVLIVRLLLPQPTDIPLCRAILLCYERDSDRQMYFTSELSETGTFFLCSWSEDGVHVNHGPAPEDPKEEMHMAVDIFLKKAKKKRAAK